jgi:hypothetical protein
MRAADAERTGVLVLRAWVEGDGEHHLRVRIARTIQGRTTESVTSASVTVEGVCTVVRAWLEDLLDEPQQLPPSDSR